jgi:transcriptional regulator with XRE-family HTH domain
MTKISNLHKKWIKNPDYKEAYDESRMEFEIAQEVIEARMKSGLSQEELAALMSTSQSAIARLESGVSLPSLRTLTKLAAAANTHIEIHFKPIKNSKQKLAA